MCLYCETIQHICVYVCLTSATQWRGWIYRRWEWRHWQRDKYIWRDYCGAAKRRCGNDLYL